MPPQADSSISKTIIRTPNPAFIQLSFFLHLR